MATTAFDMANSVANNNVYNEYYGRAADFLNMVSGSAQYNSAQMRANAATANELQFLAQQNAMNFNSSEASKNRAWQEYMSNTAHQREVRDLQAAGLNPVLSAMGGNGAAVGSGGQASVSVPDMKKADHDSGLTQGLVSFLGSMVNAQTELQKANVSALNNLAVADKYNAMTKYATDVNAALGYAGLDVSRLNTLTSAAATQNAAATSAAGVLGAAAQSAAAQRYASDQSLLASKYASDVSSENARYSSPFKAAYNLGQDINHYAGDALYYFFRKNIEKQKVNELAKKH